MGKKSLIAAAIVILAGFLLDYSAKNFAEGVRNNFLTGMMQWFSSAITITVVLVVMTSLFLIEEKKKKWIKVLILSFASSIVASTLLKLIFSRPRPMPYEGMLLSIYSFPSTHAALAFALLPVLDREFPKLKWFWIFFAVMVGASRVYLEVHYLSDVVAGAAIGYIIGKLFVWLQEKGKLPEFKWEKK